ncbi:MAG: hydroxydechloroatrazine ethylaminohydrolase, partial [uncultured bacterium]
MAADARNIDATELIVIPGLVNTHHHFYQTLTRNFPKVQDAKLFTWLVRLYPLWARITPDDFGLATTIATLELLKSGCTTAVDHSYLVPDGQSNLYYKQVEAA